jgi:hypothetical protein
MYKMGFCPNGPNYWYKHINLPGPPPSIEEVLHKILQMRSFNRYGQNINLYYSISPYCRRPHVRRVLPPRISVTIFQRLSIPAAAIIAPKLASALLRGDFVFCCY